MEENKLNELIDKTVGTKGNLQIPSYWMNKTLKDIINHFNTQDQSINLNVQDLLTHTSDLRNRLNTEKNFEICEISTPTSRPSASIWRVDSNVYNKIYISGSDGPSIAFRSGSDGILDEYIIEVTCKAEPDGRAGKLHFPESVKWLNNQPPVFKSNCITLISIANNLGIWCIFQ